ncbi:glycosyltransferase family 4 protein [Candidatus Parcubacteria bacterium]|nr:glycosyltransferase family 4 protein [Candidatus Parcubacteria bacterium]
MKKLYYIANIRMPTEKAHGIQIFSMCKAFADTGLDVTLLVPNRMTEIKEDPFAYYDIEKNFKIRKLWCLDTVRFGKLGFWLESLSFSMMVSLYAVFHGGLYYTREEMSAFYLKLIGKNPVWEAHRGERNIFIRILIFLRAKIVVISHGLKNLYVGLGVVERNILVAPDAVDFEKFNISESKEEARRKLGLARDEKIVLYTGHLYSWKGAHILAEAAREFPDGVVAVFIGGTENDIESFKNRFGHLNNIKILGKKLHKEMPLYMRAADILTIPNSAEEDISKLYTSPMKLFEYMASSTSIIASDLPSLREIIDESSAYFFNPDDPHNLAEKIKSAFKDPQDMEKKAKEALRIVKEYSWNNRAQNILEFTHSA